MTLAIASRTAAMLVLIVLAAALLSGCKHVVEYQPHDTGAHWRVEPVNVGADVQGGAHD